jgi:hypothetical protein
MSSMPSPSYHTAAKCPVRENYTGPYDPEPRYYHGPCGLRTTDIHAFLLDMLSMDESAALGAKSTTDGRWNDASPIPNDIALYSASGKLTVGQHRHIARQDPARVLAEVEAKRGIIAEHPRSDSSSGPSCGCCFTTGWPCPTLRLLALPYRDHPDYQPDWAPET